MNQCQNPTPESRQLTATLRKHLWEGSSLPQKSIFMPLTSSAKTGRRPYISSIFGCGTHRSPAGQCGVGTGCSDAQSIQAHQKSLLLQLWGKLESPAAIALQVCRQRSQQRGFLHLALGQESVSAQVLARFECVYMSSLVKNVFNKPRTTWGTHKYNQLNQDVSQKVPRITLDYYLY